MLNVSNRGRRNLTELARRIGLCSTRKIVRLFDFELEASHGSTNYVNEGTNTRKAIFRDIYREMGSLHGKTAVFDEIYVPITHLWNVIELISDVLAEWW